MRVQFGGFPIFPFCLFLCTFLTKGQAELVVRQLRRRASTRIAVRNWEIAPSRSPALQQPASGVGGEGGGLQIGFLPWSFRRRLCFRPLPRRYRPVDAEHLPASCERPQNPDRVESPGAAPRPPQVAYSSASGLYRSV
jgi:hypothetical protein